MDKLIEEFNRKRVEKGKWTLWITINTIPDNLAEHLEKSAKNTNADFQYIQKEKNSNAIVITKTNRCFEEVE